MNDRLTSREVLLAEMEILQTQVAALEARLAPPDPAGRATRSERQPLQTRIEFIADFDVVTAEGFDVSVSGICFETGQPLAFEMQFEVNGSRERRRAHLVWVRPQGDRTRLGLRFVEAEPFRQL